MLYIYKNLTHIQKPYAITNIAYSYENQKPLSNNLQDNHNDSFFY
jgi:hypothetical protein